ncbi:ABC transporter ATP-binding protein [Sulfolobus acidocaldarius]|nr:ABC transporter ATP-binding protein [Sulfolobus acidocaldarius]AGE70363.1 ABC transporter [Sulfolobus acidocaldarius N8]ALU29239.1 ABC transporter ATP-binding protein [Sulfolobus acidocaldarius]ALU31968.1 ABC transporter ATP-binding protein [Sulfolobus acidocaldarius]
MSIITIEDLWKVYKGGIEALRGISFNVNEGEIFTILGPNGAGKTTTVKILSCVLKPTKGKVIVLGYEVPKECKKIREMVSSVPQEFQGFADLSVRENIEYFASLYKAKNKVEEVLELLDLKEHEKKRFRNLSGGLKRRVAIACGIVGNPKIVFLDEPTVGLDPESRRKMWDIIRALKEKKITIFLATHYLDEAEKLADRVVVIYKGKMIKETSPRELVNEFNSSSLEDAYLELMRELRGENFEKRNSDY